MQICLMFYVGLKVTVLRVHVLCVYVCMYVCAYILFYDVLVHSFGKRKGMYLFSKFHIDCRANWASYAVSTGNTIGVKLLEAWNWPFPSNAESKNGWSYTSTSPYAVRTWTGTNANVNCWSRTCCWLRNGVKTHCGFVNILSVCIANCCLSWWLWLLCVTYAN